MSGNRSKSAFFEGVCGSLRTQISEGRGRRRPTTLLPFMWYKNICSAAFSFVTIHACDRLTDGQTDRQNYDSQDRPRICSRGKNREKRRVHENSGPMLTCLWTKVREILRQCRRPIGLPNAFADCLYVTFRLKIFANIKSRSRRKNRTNVKVFGPQFLREKRP